MKKTRGEIIVNVIFWMFPLFFAGAAFLNNTNRSPTYNWITYIGFGVLNISLFYINYLILIPEFLKKRKQYGIYLLCFFGLLAIAILIKAIVAALNPDDILVQFREATGKREIPIASYVAIAGFVSGFFLISSALVFFTTDWFTTQRITREAEMESREMELQFLKSQLNPHFLFNSLNNIYSLAYQKSEKTADAVMKLSEIMRYMIYESNTPTVTLSKEVDYLTSYIELQKIRFKDGAFVELTINGEIDDQRIVPLMLISFVENAFKHGIVNDPLDPVRINITANQKILHFSVVNKKTKRNKDAQGGVGLMNVERRLQLVYPDRYKLNVVNAEEHYTTELLIDI
ncbi:MAG: sensor histidine kinase [Pedobacter sp.]|nr:sensor histidine kinase [Pedobacter sp.]